MREREMYNAERWASAPARSRSDTGAEAASSELYAVVRRGVRLTPQFFVALMILYRSGADFAFADLA